MGAPTERRCKRVSFYARHLPTVWDAAPECYHMANDEQVALLRQGV